MPRYIGSTYKHQKALLGIARKGGGVGCGENLLGSMKDIWKSIKGSGKDFGGC
jgi:hypothetical protein